LYVPDYQSSLFNFHKLPPYIFKDNCKPEGIDLFLELLFVIRSSSFTSRLLIKWIRTNDATIKKAYFDCAIFCVTVKYSPFSSKTWRQTGTKQKTPATWFAQ